MLQTRGEGIPLADIACELEVAERTVQRDLELLQDLGFPITFDADDFGKRYWRMPHDYFKTGPLFLSLTEAISLHLARHFFQPLTGTLFSQGLDGVLEKIRSIIPAKALEHFRDLEESLHVRAFGSVDYSEKSALLEHLFEAARGCRRVELGYKSLWRRKEYTTQFDPYGIVIFEDDLFVIGHSHRANAIRVFKVARVSSVAITDASFDRPGGFSLEKTFRDSFGIMKSDGEPLEIVVRFEGPMAALVEEREWHESQRLQWLANGETLFEAQPEEPEALIATFRLSNVVEFKRWILSFGGSAEVIRPETLRHEIRSELQNAVERYQR
ncbi:MAG: transcriptional regulator [Phycisphaerales bacterium]|nr:transcriptional regulator [Phycisphaerales bacterium]MCB9855322.1 transcriptional regulator [Phycisphaerales bacterium]MCB9862915.1 transcriptional regulator [Phycisphaerales bacterium]